MDSNYYIPNCLALLVLFAPVAASAGSVLNLTEEKVIIEVENSQGYAPQSIDAGGKADFIGAVKIKYHDHEVRLDYDVEYAIWPDGSFGPQRRIKQNNRGL